MLELEEKNTLEIEPEWYILVVLPKHEIKVRDKILALSKNPAYKDYILDAVVPTYTELDKRGKEKEKVIYTDYVFVKLVYDYENDIAYHGVKVEGVNHILGAPTPLTPEEVEKMLKVKNTNEE